MLVRGSILTPNSSGKIDFFPDGILEVSADGKITAVRKRRGERKLLDRRGCLIIPGFVDTHCHLPQYSIAGVNAEDLLHWLENVALPEEAAFKGRRVAGYARKFFADVAANGTTTVSIFTANNELSANICFEEAARAGLRVIMGSVMMDRGAMRRKTSTVINSSVRLCERWNRANGGLLRYAFTPRFALSCTRELLRTTAKLAREMDAHVQTHLSESRDEVREALRMFAGAKSYTDIYDDAGLLFERSVVAHCIWLSKAESRRIAARGAGIAHCPISNFHLRSGIMNLPLQWSLNRKVGLGSDVGAGTTLFIPEVMRQAMHAQKIALAYGLFNSTARCVVSPEDIFAAATLGGARALALDKVTGSLEPGKEADFVVLDTQRLFAPCEFVAKGHDADEIISRLVFRSSPGTVLESYVRGQRVAP